ncbi:MAG: D-glycero-beta-D-manno-heptose 1-phosphate adenylyltransferase [Bacteroidota bacterium]|jgi:rfaE bifunctional protein nucleotidyltransferase chain/domain
MATIDHLRNKIYDLKELKLQLERWRLKSKKIAFTNGCFDILHLGHVDYLAKASDLADVLIIGLNTDASTRRLKGPHRPINDEQQRAMLLAAMTFVDGVVLFDEETPYELINFIRPDVLVKGADYSPEKIVGYDIVTKNGGMVTTIEFLPGYSTSAIEAKIRAQR